MNWVLNGRRGLAALVLGASVAAAAAAVAQTSPAPARPPVALGARPAAEDTIAVQCTVAAAAALADCAIVAPERLTPAEQARVLARAAASTSDPGLRVGERRTFGIVEGTRDFASPPGIAPRLALVREDALVGVGACMWKEIGTRGQTVVTGSMRVGASMQGARQAMQAEPTWAAAIAKCDPDYARHQALADMIIPAAAMKAAARDHLARNGILEASMRSAMAGLPVVRTALELRTIAVLRQTAEPPTVDWTPYLAKLNMLTGDPRARYAQLYFQAEAIENVLIYQQLRAW